MATATNLTPYQNLAQMLVKNREKIARALPKHIEPDRMIRLVLNEMQRCPDLLICTPESTFNALIEASTYGWEIGGPLAEAYLVPFKDRKRGVTEAKLIPGYRGLLTLAHRSGQVAKIVREVVRDGDQFLYDPFSDTPVQHVRRGDAVGEITHVYVCARLKDGQWAQPLVMTREEIEQHKMQHSAGWQSKDSPWKSNWKEMALKTVLRRYILHAYIPASADMLDIVRRDETTSQTTNSDNIVEVLSEQTPAPTIASVTAAIEDKQEQTFDEHGLPNNPPTDQETHQPPEQTQKAKEDALFEKGHPAPE